MSGATLCSLAPMPSAHVVGLPLVLLTPHPLSLMRRYSVTFTKRMDGKADVYLSGTNADYQPSIAHDTTPFEPQRTEDAYRMNHHEEASPCSCKVGRNIEQYALDDLNTELRDRRLEAGTSLRGLADYVNQRVLAAALSTADVDVTNALYGAVSDEDGLTTLYEALASDDTPPERTARVRTRLAQRGVDVASVEADWVTHPTVRTHLRECLDIETQRSATITADDARDTIEWARTQCANIVDQTCTRLRNANVLVTGPLDVTVTIQLTCTDCGTTHRPRQLLSRRECACTAADQSDGPTD